MQRYTPLGTKGWIWVDKDRLKPKPKPIVKKEKWDSIYAIIMKVLEDNNRMVTVKIEPDGGVTLQAYPWKKPQRDGDGKC